MFHIQFVLAAEIQLLNWKYVWNIIPKETDELTCKKLYVMTESWQNQGEMMMIIPTKQNFFDRNSQSHHKKRWKLFWKTFLFHPESLKSSYAQFSFF